MTTQAPPPGDDGRQADADDARNALALAEEAEAEAEAALADARAMAARARAERLRRQAEAGTADADHDASETVPPEDTPPAPKTQRQTRIGRRRVAVSAAALVLCGLLGLSGFMTWQVRAADQIGVREAEAAAVARQGVVNIMSLDFTNADGDVERVIDSATGKFKADFESESEFLIKALEESKVVTEVTVDAVAVESLGDDSAVVLVSAKSQASNAEDQRQDPQQFRVAVTLTRDSGALKMSQVDFL